MILCRCCVVLTLAVGSQKYNGIRKNIVEQAVLKGQAEPWDFALKLVFTAISLAVGFRGGEIVPVFAVGASFGCVAGSLLGVDPGFAAAIGLVATFCGAVNCPVASIFLSIELFGGEGAVFFAVACAVSFALSGITDFTAARRSSIQSLRRDLLTARPSSAAALQYQMKEKFRSMVEHRLLTAI